MLILTPVKDAEPFLPRYLELIANLDHDPKRLSIAFLESDSRDRTVELLKRWGQERRHGRTMLIKHDYAFRFTGPRWAEAIQQRRREVLARSRNRLLSHALRDEQWVLWLDVDLVDYPPDLIARLLASGKKVIVPHCVLPNGQTFDLNTFSLAGEVEDERYLKDGLFQPPRGVGRRYLDAFSEELVSVDSVGGTALMVQADLHREGLIFPPFPYRGYIETEGLAMMARDMGVTCYALPQLRITHAAH